LIYFKSNEEHWCNSRKRTNNFTKTSLTENTE